MKTASQIRAPEATEMVKPELMDSISSNLGYLLLLVQDRNYAQLGHPMRSLGDEKQRANGKMPLPTGRQKRHVRSRGLPRNRGLEWRWGIMTVVIRRLLMIGRAGERPVKAQLTSPVFVLSNGPPLWSAFIHFASECATKKRTDLPAVREIARVRCQCLHPQVGSVRIIAGACVSYCYRTISGYMLR
jgi:hypothetical protein